jgi:hypothetical protein
MKERFSSVASVVPALLDSRAEMIDAIVAVDGMIAAMTAYRAELIDDARLWTEINNRVVDSGSRSGWNPAVVARRELTSELAVALRLPERSTERLVEESRALRHDLPHTLDALRAGRISYRHAQVVVDHAASLPPTVLDSFEEAILPAAQTLTVAKFDRRARKQRERLHPESIESRRVEAVAKRSVDLQPARDGMAWLSAYLPAPEAIGIYNRITAIASELTADSDGHDDHSAVRDDRSLAQRRADVLTDLLTFGVVHYDDEHGAPMGAGVYAEVLVTVPVLSLLGRSDEPATLEGYGPIDVVTASRLAATAPSFTRLLTHPESGAVLSVGRKKYKVPKDLRRWLAVRDGTCRFPGCSRAPSRCDLDHTRDWALNGDTSHDNLAHLCPMHHRLKHHTEWSVDQVGGGVLEWTAPSGTNYRTQPEYYMG